MKIAIIVGTRPEAIKTASVCRSLKQHKSTEGVLVSTGQHRELLRETMGSLRLEPDYDLELMRDSQTLDGLCAQILERLPRLFAQIQPNAVLVQGDTSTAMASALCAFHNHIPVGHIEAGLRTYDLTSPFPEEANRQLIDRISRWCFAPTETSAENLQREGIGTNRIFITGNTGIDSLLWTLKSSSPTDTLVEDELTLPNDFVLLTLHRRESFGSPLRAILDGVVDFLVKHEDASVVWPVHPNPKVTEAIDCLHLDSEASKEGWGSRFHRIDPPPYQPFCRLLRACRLVLTDSGGLQEEGPSLGKRVLVARENTERPEAVDSGHNRLLGRKRDAIRHGLETAWTEPGYSGSLPAPNPYGDGRAAQRITEILLGHRTR